MKLYHVVPKHIMGKKLVPLTTLQRISPELAEQKIAKYRNRESVMATLIFSTKGRLISPTVP